MLCGEQAYIQPDLGLSRPIVVVYSCRYLYLPQMIQLGSHVSSRTQCPAKTLIAITLLRQASFVKHVLKQQAATDTVGYKQRARPLWAYIAVLDYGRHVRTQQMLDMNHDGC